MDSVKVHDTDPAKATADETRNTKHIMNTKQITKIYGADSVYIYRLTDAEDSSRRYGRCEICGKYVSDVHLQTEFTQIVEGELNYWEQGDTTWGHENCLVEKRKIGKEVELNSMTLWDITWTVGEKKAKRSSNYATR